MEAKCSDDCDGLNQSLKRDEMLIDLLKIKFHVLELKANQWSILKLAIYI